MAQVFLNVTEFGMQVQEAIEKPRFGTFTFPNSFSPFAVGNLNLEARFPQATLDKLKALGHPVDLWAEVAPAAGAVCAVKLDPETKWLHAGADPRREAYAIAW
jgi:gamma-glutamyltranspeptidase/glutathione hydrolase